MYVAFVGICNIRSISDELAQNLIISKIEEFNQHKWVKRLIVLAQFTRKPTISAISEDSPQPPRRLI